MFYANTYDEEYIEFYFQTKKGRENTSLVFCAHYQEVYIEKERKQKLIKALRCL